MKLSEAEVARRILEKTGGRFEYVSGYTGKMNPVVVRCVKCGEIKVRTYHHLTTKGAECPCAIEPHPCPVCGTMTTKKKFCCRACNVKAYSKNNKIKRRVMIDAALVDKDITVKRLYELEGGVCYLCGELTDFDDYEIRNGTIIAGNRYPSIDHVIPLSKGGTHAWDNVRLAHRRCNILKSNKMEDEDGVRKSRSLDA